jgi:hypothetical protein
MPNQTGFSALYYPYATFDDYDALKKAAVLYDKIYIVDPEEMARRLGETPRGDKYEQIHGFKDETRILWENGILEFCNPAIELPSSPSRDEEFVVNSIANDIEDIGFRRCVRSAKFNDFDLAFGKVSRILPAIKEASPSVARALDLIPRPLSSYEFIRLPDFLSVSIMINYTVYLSQKRGIASVTDDPRFHNLLLNKYNSLRYSPRLPELVNNIKSADLVGREINVQNVFSEIVPNFKMESFEDVIFLREQFKDELMAIRAICMDADVMPWDNECKTKLKQEAKKYFSDFNRKANDQKNRMVRKLVVDGAIASITAKCFGLPLWASLFSSVGLSAANDTIELLKTRNTRNRLTFLLKTNTFSKLSRPEQATLIANRSRRYPIGMAGFRETEAKDQQIILKTLDQDHIAKISKLLDKPR